MPFELELSHDKSFVKFRPRLLGETLDDFVSCIGALGDFANQVGVSRILADYREGNSPLHEDFFPALLASPHIQIKKKWRAAILVAVHIPSYNLIVAEGVTDLLNASGQVAKHFVDYSEAVAWIVAA